MHHRKRSETTNACTRMYMVEKKTTLAMQLSEEQTMSYRDATTANASMNVVLIKDFYSTTAKLKEMTNELQWIFTELAQLKTEQTTKFQSQQPQQSWNCNRHSHIRRDCPQPRWGGRGWGVRRRTREYRSTTGTCTNLKSMLVINRYVGDCLTSMLIDTGLDVFILQEDIWKACNPWW